jgi:NarL family two-component system response regulator YdfI
MVVASSPAVRVGLAAMLAGTAGLTVLESAAGPAELGGWSDAAEADVLVVALEAGESPLLPPLSPDAAANAPGVLILGDDSSSTWAGRALRSGARGALARTASTEQIVSAVMAVAAGLIVRQPSPADALIQPVRSVPSRGIQPLTAREIEVLRLLAEGLGNRSVARRLGISEHTVKSHLTSIFAKLEVSTRAEAVASAARLGLIML